jgi:hypothetical protein
MDKLTSTIISNRYKWCCRSRYWCRCGCIVGGDVLITPGVGCQDLVHLLLDLGQIVVSACSDHGPLEVVDEGPLEVLPIVDGVWFEDFKPSEGCGFKGYPGSRVLWWSWMPLRPPWQWSSIESIGASLAGRHTWGSRLV